MEQPTAGRDRFPFNCGEGVSESVADLFRHSLAAKGGIEGCPSGTDKPPRKASAVFLSAYKSLTYRDNRMNV